MIPSSVANHWREQGAWLYELPNLVTACATQWNLRLEDAIDTPHSLVIPAGDCVLKLNAPSHIEAEAEADALAAWAGAGAVRLIARDDDRRALLMERCRPGTRLDDSPTSPESAVAPLILRLSRVVGARHPFRTLADQADRWIEDVQARNRDASPPIERALIDAAMDTYASVDRTASWLVNQDLHGGNVLSAQRDPWLVIDPKPLVGERELDAVGLLRNSAWREGGRGVRRWLDALQELGLNRERMRAWGVAHAIAWGWDDELGWSPQSVEAARTIAAAA